MIPFDIRGLVLNFSYPGAEKVKGLGFCKDWAVAVLAKNADNEKVMRSFKNGLIVFWL